MENYIRNPLLTGLLLIILSIQTTYGQKMKYGVVAGLDLANWFNTNLSDEYNGSIFEGPLISFNFNGYLGYRWSDRWGNSIEPGYIRKGENRESRITLHYVQLPVLTDFYVSNKFFVSIGPELSYLLSAKTNQVGLNKVTDYFDTRFEFSGVVGVNYNIHKNLDTGIKFNHGISCIDKIVLTNDTNGEITGESRLYNRYIQCFVRFKIQ
jgi:hypothetical protein